MEAQLESTLVENILKTYAEAAVLVAETAKFGMQAILKARECGLYLIEAKAAAGESKWGAWFANHSSQLGGFTIRTAQKWMALADTPLESLDGASSLRQAYIIAGILPKPERDGEGQKSHGEASNWMSHLEKAWGELEKVKESGHIKGWPLSQRITLKKKLEPLVELYRVL